MALLERERESSKREEEIEWKQRRFWSLPVPNPYRTRPNPYLTHTGKFFFGQKGVCLGYACSGTPAVAGTGAAPILRTRAS